MKRHMLILICALLITTCLLQAARSDVPEAVVDAMNAAITAAGLEAFSAEELQWLDFLVREYPKRLTFETLTTTFEGRAALTEETPDTVSAWKDVQWGQDAQGIGDGLLVIASVYRTPRGPTLVISATVYGPNADDPDGALALADVFNAGWFGGAFKGSAIDVAVYCTRQFAIPSGDQQADLAAALSLWLEEIRSIRASVSEAPDLSAFYPVRPEPEVQVRREAPPPTTVTTRRPYAGVTTRRPTATVTTRRPSTTVTTRRPTTTAMTPRCQFCKGSGIIADCRFCGGTGTYRRFGILPLRSFSAKCWYCGGRGFILCFECP